MSTWTKVSADLADAFDVALPRSPLVERRQMFGCPCAFVSGQMFAAVHQERLLVRLPDEALTRPCLMMGRTMKEYAAFDGALDLDAGEMKTWVALGFAYAQTLPPKAPKPTKASKASKSKIAAKTPTATRAVKSPAARQSPRRAAKK